LVFNALNFGGIHANPSHLFDLCTGKVISGTLGTVASRMAKIWVDLHDGILANPRHLNEYCAGKVISGTLSRMAKI
jgi:hypothetical protein